LSEQSDVKGKIENGAGSPAKPDGCVHFRKEVVFMDIAYIVSITAVSIIAILAIKNIKK
jgi:hypothetical protein